MTGTVYRIENSDNGCGPYISGDNYDEEVYGKVHGTISSKHPTPIIEFNRDIEDEEFCGFNSIAQLKKWFNKAILRFMLNRTFQVLVYKDVKITAIGEKQVLFIKKGRTRNITKSFLKNL